MSLASELPAIVEDVALASSNADGVLLEEEESEMRVQVVASLPITAIRLGNAGVGHVPRLKAGTGLNRICDYLLVVELNGDTHAILVELKKTWEPKASVLCLKYVHSSA